MFHKSDDLDDNSLFHLVAHDPPRLRLYLGSHLFLLVAFRQNRPDPGDLAPGLAQARRVFGLSRRKTEPQANQVAMGLDEALM
jgi:hypothetical protein